MVTQTIQLVHFNDCYNIEPAAREPVGGAARFVAEVKRRCTKGDAPPLVVFSGDIYNPSLLSTITKGKQMPAILNAVGVAVSCLGVRALKSCSLFCVEMPPFVLFPLLEE